jgi:ribosomal protein L37E
MEYRCPTCQRVLYNRRLKQCGFCGAQIPESLRFTPEEIAAIDKRMADLEEQRAQRERAATEEEARRKKSDDLGDILPEIM